MFGEKLNPEKTLNFDNLKREVVDKGNCNNCGACVSFCTASRVGAIQMCGCRDNIPQWVDPHKCYNCGICYLICPQTENLNEKMRETYDWTPPAGKFTDVVSAQSTDIEILEAATDGGVVTGLLLYMLENNIIDGAIVSKRTGLFNREPDIATTRESLIEAAGSNYVEAQHLDKIGQKYTNYVPIIPAVQLLGPKRSLRIAAVGTPCQIQAIRKMQILNILPADIIHFTIGLFCMQCFAFDNLMEKSFIKKHKISPSDIKKVNVKENFRLKLKSGVSIHIPFEDIEDIARPACLLCKDFANDFADISVGGLSSPEGYTTTVIRSTFARKIFTDAVNTGYIDTIDLSDTEKESIANSITSFVSKKKERAARKKSELDNYDYIDEIIAKTSGEEIDSSNFAKKWNLENACNECERLNRNLNWVIDFVSHELCNTLSTTLLNISAIADPAVAKHISEEKRSSMLASAVGSMKLMQDMLRNYLASSKMKGGQLDFETSEVDFCEDILDKVVKRLESSFELKKLRLHIDCPKDLIVHCDKTLTRIAINNLINNAIKYSTPETDVVISVSKWENGFEFVISNEGIGIPKEKLRDIFAEFSRFDTSGVVGTGLGLFLVDRIASMHNGEIRANAGYIIDDNFVTYNTIDCSPDDYSIDPNGDDVRKFAVFTLRIPGRGENQTKN